MALKKNDYAKKNAKLAAKKARRADDKKEVA